jgi:hypothetical protein
MIVSMLVKSSGASNQNATDRQSIYGVATGE